MKNKNMTEKITTLQSYLQYKDILNILGINSFGIKNLPNTIDTLFLNQTLYYNGSIAVFYDNDLGLLALPYEVIKYDIYNNPLVIKAYSNSDYTITLNRDDFIIIYDNNNKNSLSYTMDIYAKRLSKCRRIADINITQQKTPRIFRCSQEDELSLKKIINDIDDNIDHISVYQNYDLNNIDCILSPAPYVADKCDQYFDKLWSEALSILGISNVTIQKKERLIQDEMTASKGGVLVFRKNRLEPRQLSCKEINNKFAKYLNEEVTAFYYDELDNINYLGGDDDVF